MELDKKSGVQDLQWVACMGDFVLLKDFFSRRRESFFWMLLGRFDALLRGFGQVVFANNPLSGVMIMIAFALTVPGTLLVGVATGFLGLLLSMLLSDTEDNIDNGLTVYNPALVGFVTYTLAPNIYGPIDAFAVCIILLGTIFSVYLTRSIATGRFPCLTVPFNLIEVTLLLVLTMQRYPGEISIPSDSGKNQSELASLPLDFPSDENVTTEKLNWGLVFRGVVASASQVYAVDDVAVGSVIYLAIIIYSPLTALFSFLGALSGCLLALGLRVPLVSIYAGLWGYNSLLTGAAFGGLFLVIGGQTGLTAIVAIIFTTLFQYVAEPFAFKLGLPVLTIPFVVTAWLFLGLGDSQDGTFPRPTSLTFPERELHNYRRRRRELELRKGDDSSDPEIFAPDDKVSSNH